MGLRRYSVVFDQNAADNTTCGGITSATTIRPHLFTVIFGSPATPADQAFELKLQRYTAAGTATSVTPVALDPGNPAALAAGGSNHTVEPTYTASAYLMSISINQQATFTWAVDPEYGLVAPATAANGIGLVFEEVSGGTALCKGTFHHAE